jgi:dienelactone hydrolase
MMCERGSGMTRRDWILGSAATAGLGQTVHEDIQGMAKAARLQMRFGGGTAAECRTWQELFRARLDASLGSFAAPRQWQGKRVRLVDCGDYNREELLLRADGERDVPVHLLTPKGRRGKGPGIVALHGHGRFAHDAVAGLDDSEERKKEIAGANYDFGRQLVRRGYVVAAPCFTPFGPRLGKREDYRGEDPCAVTFVRMQLLGKVLLGENLRDALWALELLAAHDAVDAQRLGCVGLSLGGRMTMMTAAVSPRVRVAVASGALNVLQERVMARYSCGAQVIPGLLQYGDVPEISSLIAPRPCLWEVGRRDALMVKEWIGSALDRMRPAWRAFGSEDNLSVDSFDGGHRWNGEQAFPLLARVLKP